MKDLSLTLLTYRHKLFNIILTDVIKLYPLVFPLFFIDRAFLFSAVYLKIKSVDRVPEGENIFHNILTRH